MAERYTVEKIGTHWWVMDAECKGLMDMVQCACSKKKTARTIARALNAYTALEQVKSIGEANGSAPPKEKEE